MPKKYAEEAKEGEFVTIKDSDEPKHLDPKCEGKFVQEGSTGDHCPLCGAWRFNS